MSIMSWKSHSRYRVAFLMRFLGQSNLRHFIPQAFSGVRVHILHPVSSEQKMTRSLCADTLGARKTNVIKYIFYFWPSFAIFSQLICNIFSSLYKQTSPRIHLYVPLSMILLWVYFGSYLLVGTLKEMPRCIQMNISLKNDCWIPMKTWWDLFRLSTDGQRNCSWSVFLSLWNKVEKTGTMFFCDNGRGTMSY